MDTELENKDQTIDQSMEENIRKLAGGSILNTFMDKITGEKDVRELAYAKLSEALFDADNLLPVARLNEDNAEVILKNYILVDFFQDYYSMIECKIKIKAMPIQDEVCICIEEKEPDKDCIICHGKGKVKGFPEYEMDIKANKDSDDLKAMRLKAYPNLITNLEKISIAWKGQSRNEILKILQGSSDVMNKKEQLQDMIRGRLM